MDLKRRDEAENKERVKDKKIMKERKENDIPKVIVVVIPLLTNSTTTARWQHLYQTGHAGYRVVPYTK